MLLIQNVQDLGRQFENNPNSVAGMDGANSIPIGDKTLWFFGDTLVGERTEGESLWYPGGEKIGPENMAGTGKIEEMLPNTALLVSVGIGMKSLQNFNFIKRDASRLKQIGMGPGFHKSALVQDENAVGMLNSRQAMCNDESRSPIH